MSPEVAFALVAAAHAGFQATVTALVYPALVEVGPAAWDVAHAHHSRRIVPLVAVLYAGLVATGVALVVHGPGVLGWVGLAGVAVALATTAVAAAPLHGRLRADTDDLRARLLVVDRVRCAGAVVGALAAACALL
ncbi:hypothetical protein [Nocardioides rubriscoriae]|uniref:hypothetical protein n=1 Tax=Nocardioides rubriscoriae TaxID=642762 RepID=UPI0011E06B94|nr:hypothetical protein [Nocardioides rubriscoriae]